MLRRYAEHENLELFIPSPKLCTDNGVMIAWNGVLKLREEQKWPNSVLRDQTAIQQLDITSRSPLGVDISKAVTDAHIKTERIDVKSFALSLLQEQNQQKQSLTE